MFGLFCLIACGVAVGGFDLLVYFVMVYVIDLGFCVVSWCIDWLVLLLLRFFVDLIIFIVLCLWVHY